MASIMIVANKGRSENDSRFVKCASKIEKQFVQLSGDEHEVVVREFRKLIGAPLGDPCVSIYVNEDELVRFQACLPEFEMGETEPVRNYKIVRR